MRCAFLILFVMASACDPGWSASGVIVDPAGAPVASATVTLACAGGNSPSGDVATTDAAGKFDFGGVGGAFNAGTCTVEIKKTGFTTKRVKIADTCYRNTEAHNFTTPCTPTDGRIVLAP
jgi:hypothetical protein